MRFSRILLVVLFISTYNLAGCAPENLTPQEQPEKEKDPEKDPDPEIPVDPEEPSGERDSIFIYNATQLVAFASEYNSGKYDGEEYAGKVFILAEDIDFSKTNSWTGIGTDAKPFAGRFSGNSYTIKNFKFSNPLFASVSGEVSDLTIEGTVTLKETSNLTYGVFARICTGAIRRCYANAEVTFEPASPMENVSIGGIAGILQGGTIEDCVNICKIKYESVSSGQKHHNNAIGGIVGKSSGVAVITGCVNQGVVSYRSGTTKVNGAMSTVGGIVGWHEGGKLTMTGCSNSGSTITNYNFNNSETIAAGTFVGGIAGLISPESRSSVTSCKTSGYVWAKRGYAGGIVGYGVNLEITSCKSESSNNSSSIGHYNGGVAGALEKSSVTSCDVRCTVMTTTNTASGGIAGKIDGQTVIAGNKFYGSVDVSSGDAGSIVGEDASGATVRNNGVGGTVGKAEATLDNVSGTKKSALTANYLIDRSSFDGPVTVRGKVTDLGGNPIKDVVIADGERCTVTAADGKYELRSDLTKTRFIYYSCPSDCEIAHEAFRPRFYISLKDCTPQSDGTYSGIDFCLTRRSTDTAAFSVIIAADPQPRKTGAGYDRIAYHSLECCEDLYRDVSETVSGLAGEKVMLCLGDLVHQDMDLFANYAAGIRKMGLPVYNVIGNHDYDLHAANDDLGAESYEKWFGPRNYSFNIGNVHFVMLDNLIMKPSSDGNLSSSVTGLSDEAIAWLESDLSYVDKDATIMVCSHAALYRCHEGSTDFANTEVHGPDYARALSKFAKVYAWAGHYHRGMAYIYPSSGEFPNVEQHTVARSTGALWLNEYLCSDGTPRGYIVASVSGNSVTWKFKPTRYQSGSTYSKAPTYSLRDYNFVSGVAKMKDSSSPLDDSYQMHVFARKEYGDKYVYANIFLYDSAWQKPQLAYEGGSVAMEPVPDKNLQYDAAYKELHDFYLKTSSKWDEENFSTTAAECHIFRASLPSGVKSATVTVTDRFGNKYSRIVTNLL